jgi:hypothetical protein
MTGRLVLRYARFIKQEGRCSGQLDWVDAEGTTIQLIAKFDMVEFPEMLRIFATHVQANPGIECCFQRTDKPGFPITPWAPNHIEQFRTDPEQTIAELSAIKTVTYDMRKKEQE